MQQAKGWALAALLSGLAALVPLSMITAMKLTTVQPLGRDYGGQAMIAFELARTPAELARVIGSDPPSPQAQQLRAAFDRANHLDFFFIACYVPFIACACAGLALRRGRRWLWLGVVLAPLAGAFDVAENLALLALTRGAGDVPALLAGLQLRTTAKWELLALCAALFAAGFVGHPRRWLSVAATLLALLAAAAGVLAYAEPARCSALLLDAITIAWLWQLGDAALALFAGARAGTGGV